MIGYVMAEYVLPELTVMQSVALLIQPLSVDERRRVASWLSQFVEDDAITSDLQDQGVSSSEEPVSQPEASEDDQLEEQKEEITSFADFYAAITPKTAWQRAAVAAWWLENREGIESWRTSAVTKLLKSIDVVVKQLSITIATKSKGDDPIFDVMSKSGDSMQARKTYRLAAAGKAYVEDKLGIGSDS